MTSPADCDNTSRRIFHNTKWLAIFALIGRSSWLVTLFLIAHGLGPALFGEISVCLSFWLIAGRVFGLGLEIWVNRYIASAQESSRKQLYAGAAYYIRFFLLLFGFLLVLLVTHFIKMEICAVAYVFALFALRQMAESLREVLVGILQGYEKMRLQSLGLIPWDVLQLLICLVLLKVFAIHTMLPFVSLLCFISIGKVITLMGIAGRFLGVAFFQNFVNRLNYFDVLKESVFLGVTVLMALALGKLDVIILRSLTSAIVVGNYSAAYVFLDACVVFFGVVRQALFPNLSRLAMTSKQGFRNLAVKSSAAFFICGCIGGVAIFFIAPIILDILGKGFDTVPLLLKWLGVSLPFVALSGALGGAVIAAGHARSAVLVQAVGLACNVAANFFWIPGYQAVGAAWATILTYWVTSTGYSFVFYRFCKSPASERQAVEAG